MTRNPRGFLFSIIFIGVAVFMMACGGDDSGGGGGSDPLNPNGGTGSNPGAGVDADLRLVGGDPITLDPALAGDAGSATYIVELFGGLVTIDQQPPDRARTSLKRMPQVTTNADGTATRSSCAATPSSMTAAPSRQRTSSTRLTAPPSSARPLRPLPRRTSATSSAPGTSLAAAPRRSAASRSSTARHLRSPSTRRSRTSSPS